MNDYRIGWTGLAGYAAAEQPYDGPSHVTPRAVRNQEDSVDRSRQDRNETLTYAAKFVNEQDKKKRDEEKFIATPAHRSHNFNIGDEVLIDDVDSRFNGRRGTVCLIDSAGYLSIQIGGRGGWTSDPRSLKLVTKGKPLKFNLGQAVRVINPENKNRCIEGNIDYFLMDHWQRSHVGVKTEDGFSHCRPIEYVESVTKKILRIGQKVKYFQREEIGTVLSVSFTEGEVVDLRVKWADSAGVINYRSAFLKGRLVIVD